MKKTLKFFAAAALVAFAAVACQKEQLSDISSEGEETVTFTVQTDAATTKASADGDGTGTGLTRCLVAVYMKTGESSYQVYETKAASKVADFKYTFTVNLIRKQTYQIVVWADKGKYTVSDDLSSVTRIAEDFACNSDAYDAFYASTEFVQGTTTSTAITAKRPFAQLNLITKDLRTGFEPKNIELTYTAASKFNPFDGTTSDPQTVTYTSTNPHYGASLANPVPAENTVAMNYLFANDEQSVLNEVKLKATFTDAVELAVANVPVRRNYRTNIKGNLFTEETGFTINVVPAWATTEIDVEWVSVATVAKANEALQNGKTNVSIESVESSSVILIPKTPNTIGISLPSNNANAVTITYKTPNESGQTPNLNVAAENNTGVLVINAPQSHVTLNGTTYNTVTASTSNTTLVVEEGVTINTLTINAGGLEIHGTVGALVITENADVVIRDCEGLSQAVYNVAAPYIAATHHGVSVGDKYDIIPYYIPGSGSQADPYIIETPGQFLRISEIDYDNKVANGTNPNTRVYFKLTSDIILGSDIIPEDQDYNTLFKYLYSVELDGKKADGGSYKVTLPDGCALVTYPYYMNLKNLDFQMYETPLVWWQVGTCLFENVDLYGSMSVSGNTGAYEIYNQATYTTFKDCTSYMTLTGIGGYRDYNSVFVGYKFGSTSNLTFENCSNKGSLVCGKASMFLGNPNSNTIVMNVNNCRNEGTLIATYTAPDYNFNYYFSTSSNNYSFTLNGTKWTHNNSLPTSYMASAFEDQLIINTGVIQNGPVNTGMKLTLNSDGTFAIAAATDNTIGETAVAKYEVSLGLYVGIENGSNRFFASEKIAADGSASYTSTIKNYQFVDKTFVGEGVITTDAAGNRIFVDGNTTYYVVEDNETVRSAPRSATMYNLSAFDAQGKLLASVTLTEDESPAPAMFSKRSARKSAAIKVEAPTRVVELPAKNIVVE